MRGEKRFTVCVVGAPNCGKTTIFNSLTKKRKITGNWSGVTVQAHKSTLSIKDLEIELVDLPGIHSISEQDSSPDEKITINFLENKKYDLILNVTNSANLKRDLYLTTQLLEMEKPVLIVSNMIDRTNKSGFEHLKSFAENPIINVSAKKNYGMDQILDAIAQKLKKPKKIPKIITHYKEDVRELIEEVLDVIQFKNPLATTQSAIKILENTSSKHSYDVPTIDFIINRKKFLEKKYDQDIDLILIEERYQFIDQALKSQKKHYSQKTYFSDFMDKLFLSRVFGFSIFLLIMYLLFTFSITFGSLLQGYFEDVGQLIFIDLIKSALLQFNINNCIINLLVEGIGGGIKTVLSFLPTIAGLYIFLSLLEESGYISRAAFLMNNLMNKLNLPGKAIIPLIIGFGCNVPSIIATRILECKYSKIMTVMMSPFMSCSARLSVFAIFASTFFPENGPSIIFLLYIIGIIFAILTGYIIKKSFNENTKQPNFIIELPEYELPSISSIFVKTYGRLKDFVIGAGKIIIVVCLILDIASSITISGNFTKSYYNEDSLLSVISKKAVPIFEPMGIEEDNWPAVVGISAGLLAKEAVIGALVPLYNLVDASGSEKDEFSTNTAASMQHHFGNKIAVFAYLLFILLYFPCISVFAVMRKEIGYRWAIASSIWSTCLAYSVSVIFYQLANFFYYKHLSLTYMLIAILTLGFSVGILLLAQLWEKRVC